MSDSAQFEWLLNESEDSFASKESKTALMSRATAVEPEIVELESRYTAIEVTMRALEGHGAFSEFRIQLQHQFDSKETKTSINTRVAAEDIPFDDLESAMSKAETAMRVAEQAFLDYLTDVLT